jgi:1,4-alpha-glucan branching enzyme
LPRVEPGELALVLHTHMPYVEGFGTWPFGEEWLWEAIATCYLPLLEVLDRAPMTLSLTPVLCDQLEAPGAIPRAVTFLSELRHESHRLDIDQLAGEPALVDELGRSASEYAQAAARLEAVDLLAALGARASWTSAATHPLLPLLATDVLIAIQVQTGIASHRRRFGDWAGGFWLPECGYAPWLGPTLEQAGVRSSCVELTGLFGLGDPAHLRPLATDAGPVLWPLDRKTMSLVWSPAGYPAGRAYRDRHRLTKRHHRPWANHGGPYDFEAAVAVARRHAEDFVARVCERVLAGGVCVCAFDTELLGHWWYEGVHWLSAVVDEAARQGLRLTSLDDALERHEPVPAPAALPVGTWGAGGDLRTWSWPPVAELAFRARAAELGLVGSGGPPPERAVRELLALQSSDWAFLCSGGETGDYPRQRFFAHLDACERVLAGGRLDPALRNLAPDLVAWLG